MVLKRFLPGATAAHLLAVSLLLGLADAAMVRLGWFGASGPWKHVPMRIWFVSPLVWLCVVVAIAAPALLVSRRYGARAASAIAAWLFVIEPASELVRPVFHATAVLAAVALLALLVLTRRTSVAVGRGASLALLAVWASIAAGAIALTGPARASRGPVSRKAPADAPNVLVVFLDAVRYDSILSPEGAVRDGLPGIARLADGGTVFQRAYASSGWTLPSHLSALTGLDAHRLGVDFDQQDYAGEAPSIAWKYRRNGYRAAAVVSNPYMSTIGHGPGQFDEWDESQNALDVCRTAPGRYLDRAFRRFSMAVCLRDAEEITTRAVARMQEDGGPWFLVLNYMEAHSPYDPTGHCGGTLSDRRFSYDPDGYARRYRADYERSVRCLDAQLGRLFDAARRSSRGSVIALTSDHGEQFGEHGLIVHANSLYPQLIHVPLIVSRPAGGTGVSGEVTSLADLPLLLEGKAPRTPGLAVASLIQRNDRSGLRIWSAIRNEWQMIVTARGRHRREELFDLRLDPEATLNRIEDASVPPEVVPSLRNEIARIQRELLEPRETSFRSLGYLQ